MCKDKHSHHLTPHTTDQTHQPHVDWFIVTILKLLDLCPYSFLRPIGEASMCSRIGPAMMGLKVENVWKGMEHYEIANLSLGLR